MLLKAYRDRDFCLTVLLFSSIAFSPVKYAFSSILSLWIDVPYHLDSIALWGILILLFVLPFLKYVRLSRDILILFCILFASWLLFLAMYPEYMKEWLLCGYRIFVRAFPYYIIARMISDYRLLKRSMCKVGYLITICSVIVVGIKIYSDTMDRYDMTLAYFILPSTVIGFWMLMQKMTFRNLLNFTASIVMLLFMGTRGPIVCFLLYFFYAVFTNLLRKRVSKQKLILSFVLLLGGTGALLFILLNPMMLAEIAQKYGLSIRLFQIISENDFFKDSARMDIYRSCMELISRFPLTGIGILSDRVGIASILNEGVTTGFLGLYPHMIFLEIVVQFGILLGTLGVVLLLYGIVRLLNRKESAVKDCAVIFLFIGVGPLLFSGSYLQDERFYVFLGMLVSFLWRGRPAQNTFYEG